MCQYPQLTIQETEAEKLSNWKDIYGISSPGLNVNFDLPHSTAKLLILILFCISIQPGGDNERERDRESKK